jgi:transposase
VSRQDFLSQRGESMSSAEHATPTAGSPSVHQTPVPPKGSAVVPSGSPEPGAHRGPGAEAAAAHGVKTAKRRPCFHCGAMTSVKTLEKTGDLCWRCYRPVGHSLLKMLVGTTSVLLLIAGLLVGWHVYFQEEPVSRKPAEDAGPKEFTAEQKVTILKRHLLDKVPAATVCKEYELSPSELRQWVQRFFEVGATAFEKAPVREPNALDRRIQSMEQRLQLVTKVLSEFRDNLTQLKKESGQYEGSTSQQYILDSAGPPPREKQ